jgi:N-acyl-D-amino-acid deacylase
MEMRHLSRCILVTFNIIIKNGRIVDGSGSPWFYGDVGVKGERIIHVGDLTRFEAERTVDASGLLVCPGFVDVHTHSDASFLVNPKADSKIRQGITTEIVGNCGDSAAPVTEMALGFLSKEYEEMGVECDWSTVDGYLRRLDAAGLPVNVATLIGHGTVRASIMGYDARDPTYEELEQMKVLVEDGMRDGAFGLSTGLKYAPGCYAKTSEVVELCKVVSRYGGIYATHIRNQGDHLIDSIDEAIEIGRKARVPVQISHLKVKGRGNWGKAGNMLRVIDDARRSGLDITFDQYAYNAGSTAAFAITPSWAREGGTQSFLERLRDPEQRKRIEEGIPEQEDWTGSEKILVAKFEPDPSYEGKSLEEIGMLRGKSRESVMCDLLLEADGMVPLIIFFGWEKDIRDIMSHHAMMVGSDGSSLASYGALGRGKPHPRNYGCFPRFLGRYVIGARLMSVEDGIRRMTSFSARRFGLKGRGLLYDGMFADITVLDPEKVIDTATFQDPHKYADGIEYVLVNGKIEVEDGRFTEQLAGKTLKHPYTEK